MKIWASNEESSFVSTVSKPPFWLSVSLMRSHPLPLPGTLGSQYFPFYRHQSVWRRDTTARVVSPGVGHEFVKLESCLFLFSPSPSSVLHFPRFPPFFFHPYTSSPDPPRGTKGQSSSWEYSEEYVDTWRYIISSSFNFQLSAIDVDGEKNIALFVSEEFRRSIIRFRVEEVKRVIFISICEKVTRNAFIRSPR